MEKINKFNIRVYALIIKDETLLILKEPYINDILYKFPGGGLEFGEGVIEGLKRELIEELNLEINSYQHFYTQEGFVRSKFRENEQILTIYYIVDIKNFDELKNTEGRIEKLMWVPLKELNENHVNLPVDKIVVNKLIDSLK